MKNKYDLSETKIYTKEELKNLRKTRNGWFIAACILVIIKLVFEYFVE